MCLFSPLTHQRSGGSIPSCSLAKKFHQIHLTELEGGKPVESQTERLRCRGTGWLCEEGWIWRGMAWTGRWRGRWWLHEYWGKRTSVNTMDAVFRVISGKAAHLCRFIPVQVWSRLADNTVMMSHSTVGVSSDQAKGDNLKFVLKKNWGQTLTGAGSKNWWQESK